MEVFVEKPVQTHRIPEWFGLERTLQLVLFQTLPLEALSILASTLNIFLPHHKMGMWLEIQFSPAFTVYCKK